MNNPDQKRLLMLTHRVPYPPDRGDRIRSWNILKYLSETFAISLGCVTEEPLLAETKTKLESVCDRVAIIPIGRHSKWLRAGASAVRGRSLTEGLFWSPLLCKTLDRWSATRPFDAVLVYCSGMLRYARRKPLRHVPRFVDLVDVDSEKFYDYANHASLWKRPLYRAEGRRVRRLEHEAVRSAKAVTLVSDAEAGVLRDTLQPAEHPIHGISNGVDTEYFAPVRIPEGDPHSSDTRRRGSLKDPHLVFVGVMNYPPNMQAIRWFIEYVWPRFRVQFPGATLTIVGKHPAAEILRFNQIAGIHVTGAVPDVRPHVIQADIVIAPLRIARGVQNKVLEAMAMERPVVATTTAVTGIQAIPMTHLLIAESPQDWIEQLSLLCCDESLRDQIGKRARDLVCQHYTWRETLHRLSRLISDHIPAR